MLIPLPTAVQLTLQKYIFQRQHETKSAQSSPRLGRLLRAERNLFCLSISHTPAPASMTSHSQTAAALSLSSVSSFQNFAKRDRCRLRCGALNDRTGKFSALRIVYCHSHGLSERTKSIRIVDEQFTKINDFASMLDVLKNGANARNNLFFQFQQRPSIYWEGGDSGGQKSVLMFILAAWMSFNAEAAHAYGPRSSMLEETVPELPAQIVKVDGKLPKYIEEPSGIAKEQNGSPGLRFWVNTDSGGPPTLWVVDGNNDVIAEVPVAAKNVDWEEVGWAQCRNKFGEKQEALLVADTGNNFGQRNKLKIYMISPIPDIPQDVLSVLPPSKKKKEEAPVILPEIMPSKTISFSFPKDQSSDFDSEALFTYNDRIWILTKRRKESTTGIYRLPTDTLSTCSVSTESKEGEGKKRVEFVGEAESGNPVTAADVSEDKKFLAVLTTSDLLYFDLSAPEAKNNPLHRPLGRVPLDLKQTEGVSWDGPVVVVTNEQRQMFRIKVQLKP